MKPTVNNRGVSHENGAIEAPHGSLKRRIAQALKLRGNSDFASESDYRRFIEGIVERLNKRCQGRLGEEQSHLTPLPEGKAMSYSPLTARVTTSSTISVKRGLYTVPSRLIGEQLRVHLYHDRLECYLGQSQVITLTRVYGTTPVGRARNIDYRHIIHSLAAKPQAFRFSALRDDLLPSASYHQLWALAQNQFTPQEACKWMVAVLRIACDHDCESVLAEQLLEQQQREGKLPALKTLQARYIGDPTTPPIPIRQHSINDYDGFLSGQWIAREAANG
ncbi:hypothetical protein AB833_05765 [Chromatiales bacterium (ex Bugula neritina AB1)]|nr:hypothetical protein AB833_05765 [Chromatiales bacterium (ex Bugula neritina AB1)]